MLLRLTFVKKPKLTTSKSKKRDIPEGLWTKCPKCGTMVFDKELDENLKVCPKCSYHFPIGARERIHSLVETCSFEEMDADMTSVDVLQIHRRRHLHLQARSLQKNHRAQGRRRHRHRQNRRAPRRARRDGFQFSRRLDGFGRRRKTDAADRSAPRKRDCRSSSFPPAAARACMKACSA